MPEKDQRDKWIVALNSCFNCNCKRTDLMCKGNCDEELTGFSEVYDDLELDDCEEEPSENIYDALDDEEDSTDKGPKGKVVNFESKWEKKVRLIPEALDSTYVYYDPHEEANRKLLNTRPKSKTPRTAQKERPIKVNTWCCVVIHLGWALASSSRPWPSRHPTLGLLLSQHCKLNGHPTFYR